MRWLGRWLDSFSLSLEMVKSKHLGKSLLREKLKNVQVLNLELNCYLSHTFEFHPRSHYVTQRKRVVLIMHLNVAQTNSLELYKN